MSKTFSLQTYGCRVNQYETQAIREQLQGLEFQEVPPGELSDLVVLNSCTVTQEADRQCLSSLRAIHKANPQARIVVMGCLVQRDQDRLKGVPGVQLLVGSHQKHRLGEWVREMFASTPPRALRPVGPGADPLPSGEREKGEGAQTSWQLGPRIETELSTVYSPLEISAFQGRSKAFVKVQDGCDRACAFCKIPYVRGRSRSRPLPQILEEVQRLVAAGFEEVVLTGVAIGLWGRPQQSLAALVQAVDRLPGRFRIRLSSLDPRDLDDPLIEVLGGSSKVCHHLHLSLQSGSDAVLARMNRGYTASGYQRKVEAVRAHWPDLGLTTDWIVGFPGETQEQFNETVRFCRSLQFAKVHVFPFSRREGTSAWFFRDCVPVRLVKERAKLLRAVADETARQFRERFIGTIQEVLVEEKSILNTASTNRSSLLAGYTAQFVRMAFSGPQGAVGQLVPVEVQGASPGGLEGAFFSSGTLDKLPVNKPSLSLEQETV